MLRRTYFFGRLIVIFVLLFSKKSCSTVFPWKWKFVGTSSLTNSSAFDVKGVFSPGNWPTVRTRSRLCHLGESKFLMFGGQGDWEGSVFNDIWIYDSDLEMWSFEFGEIDQSSEFMVYNPAYDSPGQFSDTHLIPHRRPLMVCSPSSDIVVLVGGYGLTNGTEESYRVGLGDAYGYNWREKTAAYLGGSLQGYNNAVEAELGAYNIANILGAHISSVMWYNPNLEEVCLYGGEGKCDRAKNSWCYDHTTSATNTLCSIWCLNISSGMFKWLSGEDGDGCEELQNLDSIPKNVFNSSISPGSRSGHSGFQKDDLFFVLGGWGQNNILKYNITSGLWALLYGHDDPGEFLGYPPLPVFGVFSKSTVMGSRSYSGFTIWEDKYLLIVCGYGHDHYGIRRNVQDSWILDLTTLEIAWVDGPRAYQTKPRFSEKYEIAILPYYEYESFIFPIGQNQNELISQFDNSLFQGRPFFECFGFKEDDPSACSNGNGLCVADSNCTCLDGYFGDDCGIAKCHGIWSNSTSPKVCSGRGLCRKTDICECSGQDLYGGIECNIPYCFGIIAGHPKVCSGRGICLMETGCNCDEGYFGDCSTPICEPNCVFGICVSPNLCQCEPRYIGESCSILNTTTCDGILTTDEHVCSGHGTCIIQDECECDEGYDGENCRDIIETTFWTWYWITIVAVGAVVAGILALICTLLPCCCCACAVFRKQRKRLAKLDKIPDLDILLEEHEMETQETRKFAGLDKKIFNIPYSSIKLKKSLGKGGFCEVFLVTYNQELCAYKSFKISDVLGGTGDKSLFKKEVTLLSRILHPHCVAFLGAVDGGTSVGILTEYCSEGDLENYLVFHKARHGYTCSMSEKLRLLSEAASGMNHLHSLGVIHRDLKPQNLLVTHDRKCKVADFGLARVSDSAKTMTRNVGTRGFIAPEIVRGTKYDKKADVWSFAFCIYCCCEDNFQPLADLGTTASPEMMISFKDPSWRPKLSRKAYVKDFKWVPELVDRCWESDSKKRPDFEEVLKILRKNNKNKIKDSKKDYNEREIRLMNTIEAQEEEIRELMELRKRK